MCLDCVLQCARYRAKVVGTKHQSLEQPHQERNAKTRPDR